MRERLRRLAAVQAARGIASFTLVLLGGAIWSCGPAPTQVTTTADGAAGSLREALQRANGSSSAVRIELPAGTYELTVCGADDDNAAGDLDVTTAAPVTIVGTGPDVVIKQTCAGERVIDGRGAGVLTLEGLTLTGGNVTGNGGAIQGGAVALTRVHVVSNTASGSGGGIAAATLTGDELLLRDNTASEFVGGLGGGAFVTGNGTLRKSRVESNKAARGAGVLSQGKLALADTAVLGNTARARTSTVHLVQTDGGGVVADELDANRVTFANNYADACPGFAQSVGSFGSAVSARTAALVNTTLAGKYPTCWSYPAPLGRGGMVRVTEALSLDHATVVDENGSAIAAGSVTTRRSLIDANVCNASTSAQFGDAAYSWFTDTDCVLNGPGNFQGPGDLRLGDLTDAVGALPTVAPYLASALVDKVPSSACPVRVDARGVARPQGSACDIGAVEVVYPANFGPTDLGVSITSPGTVTAGQGGTWQVHIRNKGTNAAAPTLTVTLPEELTASSFTPSAGGSCKRRTYPEEVVTCEFSGLAAGETATLTLTGDVAGVASTVGFTAAVNGPQLLAPFTDDTVSTSSAVNFNAALQLEVSPANGYTPLLYNRSLVKVTATIRNLGPFSALSANENVIGLVFKPAPGVAAASQTQTLSNGSYPKDYAWSATFDVIIDGIPTAPLGTVQLLPGRNQVSGPVELPIVYEPPPPPAELTLQVRRQPGVTASGDAVPVEVEVTNHGPNPALALSVRVNENVFAVPQPPNFTWSTPAAGTLSTTPDALFWHLTSLPPGSSATLRGTAVVASNRRLTAAVSSANDVNLENNSELVSVEPTPLGTADLEVTSVVLRPGASGTQQIARVTITNTGPAPIASDWARLLVRQAPSGSISISSAPVTANGSCAGGVTAECKTTQELAPSDSAVFDYTLGGVASGLKLWFAVYVSGNPTTVDPNSGNDSYWVWQ